MNIIKPIIAGILIGAALFFMPFFFIRFILFFLIIGAIFRFFIGGRFRGYRRSFDTGFTDNIRSMSDEEYSRFKQNLNQGCGYHNYNRTQSATNPQ
ncbi:hypothetical protein FC093_04410 [Ilyomonas limi]|uniref:Uncharacterized protein n=1 Tax=Ilyomonas limi TaxID=2575867 RepID=A0A4U3L6R4_9BACT|nr:hypothetical protein [Ilyomonas limi]TKK70938.1 hypothetical protein FC093_04410 [Ilyomonas limi]